MDIRCPLVNNKIIDDIDCLENSDVVDGMIKEKSMPKEFKIKQNWREICKSCNNHRE